MTAVDLERTAVRDCGKPKRQQVDRDRIVRLWTDGWSTQAEIAELCRCSIATVRKVLIDEGFQREWSVGTYTWKTIERERWQR